MKEIRVVLVNFINFVGLVEILSDSNGIGKVSRL